MPEVDTQVTTLRSVDHEQEQGQEQEASSSSSATAAGDEQVQAESNSAEENAPTAEITQVVLVDEDGQTVGYIPLSFEGDTVAINVNQVSAPAESWYTDTGETMTVATVSLVVILVFVFAIFGTMTVGTLLRSFEVGKDA